MLHKVNLIQKEINAQAIKNYTAEMVLIVNLWGLCVRRKGLKKKSIKKSPLSRSEQLVEGAP